MGGPDGAGRPIALPENADEAAESVERGRLHGRAAQDKAQDTVLRRSGAAVKLAAPVRVSCSAAVGDLSGRAMVGRGGLRGETCPVPARLPTPRRARPRRSAVHASATVSGCSTSPPNVQTDLRRETAEVPVLTARWRTGPTGRGGGRLPRHRAGRRWGRAGSQKGVQGARRAWRSRPTAWVGRGRAEQALRDPRWGPATCAILARKRLAVSCAPPGAGGARHPGRGGRAQAGSSHRAQVGRHRSPHSGSCTTPPLLKRSDQVPLLAGPRWRIGPADLKQLPGDLSGAQPRARPARRTPSRPARPGGSPTWRSNARQHHRRPRRTPRDRAPDWVDPFSPLARRTAPVLALELRRTLRSHAGLPLPDLISEVERRPVSTWRWPQGGSPLAARADLDAFLDAASRFAGDAEDPWTLGAFPAYSRPPRPRSSASKAAWSARPTASELMTVHLGVASNGSIVIVPASARGGDHGGARRPGRGAVSSRRPR